MMAKEEFLIDRLTDIFRMQLTLIAETNKTSGEPILINDEKSLSRTCVAILHEVVELQSLTNWKWWKNPVAFDHDLAKEELVDVLHFVVQACVILNLKPSELLQEFKKKHQINMERQR